MLVSMSPQLLSIALSTPNWSCMIQAHILADTMVGIAQGTSTAARTSARPLKLALSTSANTTPSTVSSTTETAANWKVLRIAMPQSVRQKPCSAPKLKTP
jgi:hypothetical protein